MKNFPPLLFSLIMLCLLVSPGRAELGENISSRLGSLSGHVFVEGRPQPHSVVAFFQEKNGPPTLGGGGGRVPEFLSRTDAEGVFKSNLPTGRYFVGILARASGAPTGPPRPGEKIYFAVDAQGHLLLLTVLGKKHVDTGRLNVAPSSSFVDRAAYFQVEGVVRDEHGAPVADVVVLGKSRLNIPRPEFISARTKSDGHYSLKLPAGRLFYLVARQDVGNYRPQPGTRVGTYGIRSNLGLATLTHFSAGSPPPGVMDDDPESRAQAVSGRPAEVRGGFDIYMYPLPDPEKVKKTVQTELDFPSLLRQGKHNILFEGSSLQVSKQSTSDLERWASFLLGRGELGVELTGYTDNIGVLSQNIVISQKRAKIVADFLISRGVEASRIKVSGKGPLNPVAPNRTSASRALNRRVEIRIVGGDN